MSLNFVMTRDNNLNPGFDSIQSHVGVFYMYRLNKIINWICLFVLNYKNINK